MTDNITSLYFKTSDQTPEGEKGSGDPIISSSEQICCVCAAAGRDEHNNLLNHSVMTTHDRSHRCSDPAVSFITLPSISKNKL